MPKKYKNVPLSEEEYERLQLVAKANLKDGKQYSKALIGVEFAIAALQWALPRVK